MRTTAIVLWLACVPAHVHAESVTDAVLQALNHHPSVEAAIANRDALTQERREYVSDYYPQLELYAGSGRMYGDNSTSRGLSVSRGTGYSWVHEASLSMRQMIFDGLETPNRVDAATARAEAAQFQILSARESLALRAVAVYLDVLRNQEILAHIRAHEAKLDDYIKRIESMVAEGVVDESLAAQARDVRAQLNSTAANVDGALATALADYREIVGQPPQGGFTRPADLETLIGADVDQVVTAALQSHPALKAADQAAYAYQEDAAAEKGTLLPDVSAELSYLKRDQRDLLGGEYLDARGMLRMNWTLQTGGEQFARIKKAQYRESEARANRGLQERQIERAIRAAYADMKSSKNQREVLQERLRLSRDLLRTQNTQFEGARITLLQLMQTENALFNSEMSLLNGEYRHLAAQYAALAGTGQLQQALSIVPASSKNE
ncbi:MAG TPA: TolC family protein [Micavibrio sp.]